LHHCYDIATAVATAEEYLSLWLNEPALDEPRQREKRTNLLCLTKRLIIEQVNKNLKGNIVEFV
jgi:hypothetical protein